MSIADRNRIEALEARIAELERRLGNAESLCAARGCSALPMANSPLCEEHEKALQARLQPPARNTLSRKHG